MDVQFFKEKRWTKSQEFLHRSYFASQSKVSWTKDETACKYTVKSIDVTLKWSTNVLEKLTLPERLMSKPSLLVVTTAPA